MQKILNKFENKNEDYSNKLQSMEWKLKRQAIIKRDNFRCMNCGSTQTLQVHHKQYQNNKTNGKKRNPWDYHNKYLITLCEKCHHEGHRLFKVPIFNI